MPSIIPSYVYTLFATIIVGTIVVSACGISTLNVRNEFTKQQLSSLSEYIAIEGLELIIQTKFNNVTSRLQLNIPDSIGNQIYWIRIMNSTLKSWVEAGFGETPFSSQQRTYIPSKIVASGAYFSGSGQLILECNSNTTGTYLTISGEN